MAVIAIRMFEPRDLPRIVRIERASFGEFAWPASTFESLAFASRRLFLVAYAGRVLAGYSVTVRSRHGAELVSIAVYPRYRRHHVASALLRTTIRKVRRSGAAAMWLMVRRENAGAIAFYRKFGFVRTATVAGYYEDGAAGWRMRLALD